MGKKSLHIFYGGKNRVKCYIKLTGVYKDWDFLILNCIFNNDLERMGHISKKYLDRIFHRRCECVVWGDGGLFTINSSPDQTDYLTYRLIKDAPYVKGGIKIEIANYSVFIEGNKHTYKIPAEAFNIIEQMIYEITNYKGILIRE